MSNEMNFNNIETTLRRVNTGLACIAVGTTLVYAVGFGRAWVQVCSERPQDCIHAQETMVKLGLIALGAGIGAFKGTFYGAVTGGVTGTVIDMVLNESTTKTLVKIGGVVGGLVGAYCGCLMSVLESNRVYPYTKF